MTSMMPTTVANRRPVNLGDAIVNTGGSMFSGPWAASVCYALLHDQSCRRYQLPGLRRVLAARIADAVMPLYLLDFASPCA